MAKKNIIITGGAGFIGSHLSEALLKEANVICADNFINSHENNINHLVRYPNFEFIRHDISEPLDLGKFPELEKFQIKVLGIQEIYHLACPTSAKNFDKFKIQTLLANSLGIKNILDLAVKYKAKFLHASTSVVYGSRKEDNLRLKEEDLGIVDQLSSRSCYDEGKRFAEAAVATYHQVYGMDFKIARIFRTYGPRERLFDGEMIPDFIVDAAEGRDLVIYGDENFKTSLTYVSDIVDGLIRLMDASADIGPVNLGSDRDLLLIDVARKVIEITNSKSKIIFKERLPFITELSLPDISKAKERLDWVPLVRLEDGLKKTLDYTLAHKELLGI